jgi:hypothetical protein
VSEGKSAQFVGAFKEFLDFINTRPHRPDAPVLLKSKHDDRTYYSVARWPSLEAVDSMRGSAMGAQLLQRVAELCDEWIAGSCELVLGSTMTASDDIPV